MEPDEENGVDSHSSESEDEDYHPNAEPAENINASEEEDDGDPDEKTEKKFTKRKLVSGGGKKAKRRRQRGGDEDSEDDSDDQDFSLGNEKDTEDDTDETETEDLETVARRELIEKERTDRLWADFLTDVETTKAKRKEEKETGIKTPVEKVVTKIYDFAGERVSVQEKVRIEQPSTASASNGDKGTSSTPETPDGLTPNGSETGNSEDDNSPKQPRKYRVSFLSGNPADIGLSGGKGVSAKEGLANVLNALHARNKKIGTLEKSKLDWEAYKRDQNIDEELSQHNRSKHGFIDKQEFLQRADVRQFEIEKAARIKTRRPI